MVIYFLICWSYWTQCDWSGSDSQWLWSDTSSYWGRENVDGRIVEGELRIFAPSGDWESSEHLLVQKEEVNALIEYDSSIIYAGCGWDSARVLKLGNFGSFVLCKKTLGPGRVLSLLKLHNGSVLAGLDNGDLFIGKDTNWVKVKNFGAKVLCIYQRPDFYWIYLGTSDGRIWRDETGSGLYWDAFDQLSNTSEVHDIFYSSPYYYACTKSTTAKGELFSTQASWGNWQLLYTFPGASVAYSICESPSGELYVSTGDKGGIFVSPDFGMNWQKVPFPFGLAHLYTILVDLYGIIYVGGRCEVTKEVRPRDPTGLILMSPDRGVSWDTIFYPTGWKPTKISGLMQSRYGFMFASGDTGVVFRSGYHSSGWLESSWFDAFADESIVNRSLEFGRLHYDVSGSGCAVRVRSCWDLDSIPEWGDIVPNDSNPVSSGSANNGDRYIQYRVELYSDLPLLTSIVKSINLKYKIDVAGPILDSAVAFDGVVPDTGIGPEDYIILYFNEPTNMPWIETNNIDAVFRLSSSHSWRSDSGNGVIKYPGEWVSASILKIYLSTLRLGVGEGYPPTIDVGDTIYPDSSTIMDKWLNPCWMPCVIKGSFDPVGVEENPKSKIQNPKLEVSPNPFSESAIIWYELCESGKVSLKLYDITGRVVMNLVDEEKEAGVHKIMVQGLRGGIYFLRFELVGSIISTRKIVRLGLGLGLDGTQMRQI